MMTDHNNSSGNGVVNNIQGEGYSHPVMGGLPEADFDDGHMVLAMSYVKRQKWSEPLECGSGLAKGTIFPELVKPFLGQGGYNR